METPGEAIRKKSWFETVYKVAVGLKGLNGALELVSGILLLISPSLLHRLLAAILGEAQEHNGRVFRFLAEYIAGVDADLLKSGLWFLTAFLLIHGIVKLALVYCLLKEIVRAYPVALIILSIFLLYQIYVLIVAPGPLMIFLTLLDAVIIWLVWNEYQKLKTKAKKEV